MACLGSPTACTTHGVRTHHQVNERKRIASHIHSQRQHEDAVMALFGEDIVRRVVDTSNSNLLSDLKADVDAMVAQVLSLL
jgi:hypothetical protein